jgi:hypothetical protein
LFHSVGPNHRGSIESALANGLTAITAGQNNPGSISAAVAETPRPAKSAGFVFEADLHNEDDEERRHTVSNCATAFKQYSSCNKGVYDGCLKHLFLHLNSEVDNRPTIAFFILYHSWKSDLA